MILIQLEFFSFGIYHVKIYDIDFRTFKENKKNWYTHTDLNYAKTKLKLKISLIEDEEPNALLYDNKKLMTGNKLFGPFINYLFEFKKAGHKEIKKYISSLWGTLSQFDIMTLKTDVIREGKVILTITPDNNGKLTFETALKDKFYELDSQEKSLTSIVLKFAFLNEDIIKNEKCIPTEILKLKKKITIYLSIK
jgi:hypothetical protein